MSHDTITAPSPFLPLNQIKPLVVFTNEKPITDPTTAWVVDTGTPNRVAPPTIIVAASDADSMPSINLRATRHAAQHPTLEEDPPGGQRVVS